MGFFLRSSTLVMYWRQLYPLHSHSGVLLFAWRPLFPSRSQHIPTSLSGWLWFCCTCTSWHVLCNSLVGRGGSAPLGRASQWLVALSCPGSGPVSPPPWFSCPLWHCLHPSFSGVFCVIRLSLQAFMVALVFPRIRVVSRSPSPFG